MIALTKEKREELIACANEIKKIAISTHGYKVGNDAFGSNALMLMEIALASLTAEPTYSRYRLIAKGSGPDAEKSPWFPGDGKTLRKSHEVEVNNLFTAPPVPEIKLPDIKGYAELHTQYSEGVVDGYNRCLAEIKRLNGLAE